MNTIPKASLHRSLSRLAFCTAAVACLSAAAPARAQEFMSWTFYNGGAYGKSGSATNGTVIDSASETTGYGTTLGTVNAKVNSSDLYLYYSGGSLTYGEYTQFGSRLHLWAYNYPGQTGPLTLTITPFVVVADWFASPNDTYSSFVQIDFSLTTLKNGTILDLRQYSTALQGRTLDGGIKVLTDAMTPATLSFADGDEVQFNLFHQISAAANFWATTYGKSQAFYTVVCSSNGYLSAGPRFPDNPPLPALAPPQVSAATVNFTDPSHSQVTVSGTGGPTNAPLSYYVLTATNLALPLSSWAPCLTNRFATDGTFSFTMSVNPNEPQRFFRLLLSQH